MIWCKYSEIIHFLEILIMRNIKQILFFIIAFFVMQSVHAKVTLHGLFRDGMVLQRNVEIPVYGTASEGEKITVIFNKETKTTETKDGKWKVFFKSTKAGGPYKMIIKGENEIVLKKILVGDVWICGGQSNMQWKLSQAEFTEEDLKNAKNKKIRLYTVSRRPSPKLETEVPERDKGWVVCTAENAKQFSAVGYFFGEKIQTEIGVPIGLIASNWGGTAAELWTPKKTLNTNPEFAYMHGLYEVAVKDYPKRFARHEKQLKIWEQQKANGLKGKALGRKPKVPSGSGKDDDRSRPSSLYNGMIQPLVEFPIKGVIWYQGEANAHTYKRCTEYSKLFPAMIKAWRKSWEQDDLPFLFVQLAAFKKVNEAPEDPEWAWLREAQTKTLTLPNTGMASAIDIGMEKKIHPTNKKDVGHRLALNALKIAYGKDIVHSGPTFKSKKIADNKIIITFDNVGSGLTAKDVLLETHQMSSSELKGFAICGEDKKFVWAKAEIKGNQVIVSSPEIKNPIAVRYGWANFPLCNLYNKEGLPAVSFRTDGFSPLKK